MKSTLRIEFDHNLNTPFISIVIDKSSTDMRDQMLSRLFETHPSHLKIVFDQQFDDMERFANAGQSTIKRYSLYGAHPPLSDK